MSWNLKSDNVDLLTVLSKFVPFWYLLGRPLALFTYNYLFLQSFSQMQACVCTCSFTFLFLPTYILLDFERLMHAL